MNRLGTHVAWIVPAALLTALTAGCTGGSGSSPSLSPVAVTSAASTTSAAAAGSPSTAAASSSPPASSAAAHPTAKVTTIGGGPMVFDAKGNLYMTDCYGGYVIRIDPHKHATVYAGNGVSSVMGSHPVDGTPKLQTEIDCPSGLAIDASGQLLVSDHASSRILAITSKGTTKVVVGMGPPGTTVDDGALVGDGGPALQSQLQEPTGLRFVDGSLFIADRDNHAVRKVAPDSIITTVAGTGDPGFSGDGGAATKAKIYRPGSIAVMPGGVVYFTDTDGLRLRKVDAQGAITTVAGKGSPIRMDPADVLTADAHTVLVVDTNTDSVRALTTDGHAVLVAGKPTHSAPGDEKCTGIPGPATQAHITPSGLTFGPGGRLYISTNTCGVLRLWQGTLTQYLPATL